LRPTYTPNEYRAHAAIIIGSLLVLDNGKYARQKITNATTSKILENVMDLRSLNNCLSQVARFMIILNHSDME
jgi:hypothetical protein